MSEALPKSLHLFGVRAAYSVAVEDHEVGVDVASPPSVIVALPDAAVAGAVVRSPVSDLER